MRITRRAVLGAGSFAAAVALVWWARTEGRRDSVVPAMTHDALRPPKDVASELRDPSADELRTGAVLETARMAAPTPTEPADAEPSPNAIRGVVLERGGAPLASADVVFVWDEAGAMRKLAGVTDSLGRFALETGAAGVRGDVLANTTFGDFSPAVVRDVTSGALPVEVRLGNAAPVAVHVRDQHDRPLDASHSIDLVLAGHRISFETRGGFSWRIDRPPTPFFATVRHAQVITDLGPIDPEGLGDTLVLRVPVDHEPAGAIVGRVVLPEGRRPDEICLFPFGGRAYRTLRADGTYEIPDVEPGRHRIEVWAAPIAGAAQDDWIAAPMYGERRAPDWLELNLHHVVGVESGAVARLDIDLTAAVPVRLEGRLRIDGANARIQFAYLRSDDLVSEMRVPAEFFVLGAWEPGEHELYCEVSREPGVRWAVSDRIALEPGAQSWSLDLDSGSLRVIGGRIWSAGVRRSGPGALRIDVGHPDEDVDAVLYRCVPAGTLELTEVDDAGELRTLEFVVRPGETTEVRWPQ